MSKVARKVRAANARPGTIAADRRIDVIDAPEPREAVHYSDDAPIPTYVAPAFTEEEMETMPLVVVNSTTTRVQVWRGPDGAWYRRGAWLRLQPRRDGEGSEFRVLLCKGANRADLEAMLKIVESARAGRLKQRWEKRGKDWASWADDRTYTYAFNSRTYVDPYTHSDLSPDVTACTEPLCVERWHEDGTMHRLDEITRKLPERRGQYSLAVTMVPGEAWQVDLFTDEFFGTPDEVAALVSDLQWMAAECRRANERTGERAAA
ncbi:hypothetical protein [Microbacterium enclense]|uniref:hypothetical protein n=1 Tax=Microbacterium enclense TaxID=993073 RepID=UPI003D70E400